MEINGSFTTEIDESWKLYLGSAEYIVIFRILRRRSDRIVKTLWEKDGTKRKKNGFIRDESQRKSGDPSSDWRILAPIFEDFVDDWVGSSKLHEKGSVRSSVTRHLRHVNYATSASRYVKKETKNAWWRTISTETKPEVFDAWTEVTRGLPSKKQI